MAAVVVPDPLAVQGPRNANLQIPRTPIPVPAGLTAKLLSVGLLQATTGSNAPPGVPADPVLSGGLTYTTFNDWYYRIHVVPAVISLGNLSGDVTRPVLVWNAFFSPVTLDAVTLVGGDGITVAEPVVPPAALGPLRALNYTVSVSASGPSVIDAVVTWTIDGVQYPVPITGRRSVLFPFRPDWRTPLTETFTWTTTVTKAWSGREQRVSIAKDPRREVGYRFTAKSDGMQLLDAVLFGWAGRFYSLPIWHEESRLLATVMPANNVLIVDTTHMTLVVGGTVVLYYDAFSYEVIEVESFTETSIVAKGVVDAEWPAGTKVVPAAPALPQADVRTTRILPHVGQASVTMLIDPKSRLLRMSAGTPDALYRGEELFLSETDWGSPLDVPYRANRFTIDSGLGPVTVIRRGAYPETGRSFRWMAKTKERAARLREFFARRAGRFKPVWMPSGTEDFILAAATDPVSPSMVVRKSQYGSMVWPSKVRRDVVIILRDGSRLLRRITDVAEGASVTVLTLDSGFGLAIAPEDVKRISYLGLYRLADDTITFNWITNSVLTIETDLVLTESE